MGGKVVPFYLFHFLLFYYYFFQFILFKAEIKKETLYYIQQYVCTALKLLLGQKINE